MNNKIKNFSILLGIGIVAGAGEAGYLATRQDLNRPLMVCVDVRGREVMSVNSKNEVTFIESSESDEPITCKPKYAWFQEPETMTVPIPPTPPRPPKTDNGGFPFPARSIPIMPDEHSNMTIINGKPIVFDERGCPPEGYITPGGLSHITIDGKKIPEVCFEKTEPHGGSIINGKPLVFDEHGCPAGDYLKLIDIGTASKITIDGKIIPASCFDKAKQ